MKFYLIALSLILHVIINAQTPAVDWVYMESTNYTQQHVAGIDDENNLYYLSINYSLFGKGNIEAVRINTESADIYARNMMNSKDKKMDIPGKTLCVGKDKINYFEVGNERKESYDLIRYDMDKSLNKGRHEKTGTLKKTKKSNKAYLYSTTSQNGKYKAIFSVTFTTPTLRDYLSGIFFPLKFFPRSKKWYKHNGHLFVFDENDELVYKEHFQFGEKPEIETFNGLEVSNNGSVVLGTSVVKTKSILSASWTGDKFNESEYFYLVNSKGKKKINLLEQVEKVNYNNDRMIVKFENDKFHVVSSRLDDDEYWKGLYLFQFDKKGKKLSEKHLDINTEDFIELDKKAKRRKSKGKDYKIPKTNLQYFYIMEDGSYLLGAEEFTLEEITRTTTSRTAGGAMTFDSDTYYYSLYGNTIIAKLDGKGNIIWKEKIEKDMKVPGYYSHLGSFFLSPYKDTFYYMHTLNYKAETNAGSSNVKLITLNKNGNRLSEDSFSCNNKNFIASRSFLLKDKLFVSATGGDKRGIGIISLGKN